MLRNRSTRSKPHAKPDGRGAAANFKSSPSILSLIKEGTRSCKDGDPAAARSVFCSFIQVLDERAISKTLERSGPEPELPSVASAGREADSEKMKNTCAESVKTLPDKFMRALLILLIS